MILDFTAVRMDDSLDIEVHGDVLTLNGVSTDFEGLGEGETWTWAAIGSEWIGSDAVRQDGEVRLTIILPCGPEAPAERRFLPPRHVTEAGLVPLPPFGEAWNGGVNG